ncbi:MAG: NADH:flavin oxidoreductase [Clostridiaceae bacterium]
MDLTFTEVTLKRLTSKNRIVRSAIHDPFGSPEGYVTEKQKKLYNDISSNNVGIIITGHVCVAPLGRVSITQNCFYNDSFLDGQRDVAKIIKQNKAIAILQISHAGANANPTGLNGKTKVAPSNVTDADGNIVARGLTVDDILEIKQNFTDAAVRAKKAGFDGIQLHCAHGYLLSNFINPIFNKRTDEYGGSIDNRFKLIHDIIKEIQKAAGEDFPILIKINSNIEENDVAFESEFMYMMKEFSRLGVEAIEISGYNFTPLGRQGKKNYFLERAAKARRDINIPIILVGGIRSQDDIEEVLHSGIEMVSLARPFICEYDFATKLKNGQLEAKCNSCSKCFFLYQKEGRRCIQHDKPAT